ncbi:Methyltransferase-like protein 4 [Aspergillus alliaceus]|uniref:Methyltransferase-like protein 4 n=1 Tax=Petromyces alliaceus TaxID=209559 RepID=A0A8H6ADM8_PETAA|nr:Methyltransferase-like protein 4 [Aspergillus burnettii]
MTRSSILYQNSQNTVFLLDIPTSIALAQDLSSIQQEFLSDSAKIHLNKSPSPRNKNASVRRLLSSAPLRNPFPGSTEPKTDAARAKVLQRIPVSERGFHDVISPLVIDALHEIREGLHGHDEWCLDRIALMHGRGRDLRTQGEGSLGKRRRNEKDSNGNDDCRFEAGGYTASTMLGKPTKPELDNPPLILSAGSNLFDSMSSLCNLVVRNTSPEHAIVRVHCALQRPDDSTQSECAGHHHHTYDVPPLSSFLLCRLHISQSSMRPNRSTNPIPGLPRHQKFDLILLDPPWLNRSVRRSGHYHTQNYMEGGLLTQCIRDILRVHLQDIRQNLQSDSPGDFLPPRKLNEKKGQKPIAAMWITNSARARKAAYDAIQGAGLSVCEEWVWIKTTTNGDPITPLNGLWRKPYEVLIIGMKQQHQQPIDPLETEGNSGVIRRFIAAVPDVHSRKPNLREIFEKLFFADASTLGDSIAYSALEVFARNLTSGWWACGDEALKFNSEEWWVDGDDASLI